MKLIFETICELMGGIALLGWSDLLYLLKLLVFIIVSMAIFMIIGMMLGIGG